jgi:hypothetical protein
VSVFSMTAPRHAAYEHAGDGLAVSHGSHPRCQMIDSAVMTEIMTKEDLRRYALVGAEMRLLQIAEEAAAIHRVFPELRDRTRAGTAPPLKGEALARQRRTSASGGDGKARRKSAMSAAQRRAVSERMKKYWATRRAEAEGDGQAATGASVPIAQTQTGGSKAAPSSQIRRGPRKMSAVARKRIAEAQRARWAKVKAGGATGARKRR